MEPEFEGRVRMTQKEVKYNHFNVIAVPHYALVYLLWRESSIAYYMRKGLWAADIYQFGSIAIVTGCHPFGDIRPAPATNKAYDDKARIIVRSGLPPEEKARLLDELIRQYINDVREKGKGE